MSPVSDVSTTHYEHAAVPTEARGASWRRVINLGTRDYEALDLEGRFWNFSHRLRDVEPADWGARRVD